MKYIYKLYGWIFIRPIRYLFIRMVFNTCDIRVYPVKDDCFGWKMPNFHWWLLYKTVFRFFKWLHYDAWRYFCDWTGGYRRSYPLVARVIHRIGKTTAGYAIGGGQCYHCGSEHGDPVGLSDEESGESYFELIDSGATATMDGTDHWFRGITTCPKCGYRQEYSDGSL